MPGPRNSRVTRLSVSPEASIYYLLFIPVHLFFCVLINAQGAVGLLCVSYFFAYSLRPSLSLHEESLFKKAGTASYIRK